jgi:hypothetical protein
VRRSLLAVAVAGALLASGCGSSNKKADATVTPRQRFVQRADAFCTEQATQFRKIRPISTDAGRDLAGLKPQPKSFKELGRFTDNVQRVSNANLPKLRAIPRPKGDALVERWESAYLDTLKALQLYHLAAVSQNTVVLQGAEKRNEVAQRRYRRLSQQLGFTVCGGAV